MAEPIKPTPQKPPVPESLELQTLGFWPTFLYYFVGTTVIGALSASQALHLGLSNGQPFLYGLPLGLLAGSVGAYYNRTTCLEISAPKAKQFSPKFQQLQQLLLSFGYEAIAEADASVGYRVYRRSGLSHWFSGSLLVKSTPTSASIVGLIRRLQRQLAT
jgi:hypothetical protein